MTQKMRTASRSICSICNSIQFLQQPFRSSEGEDLQQRHAPRASSARQLCCSSLFTQLPERQFNLTLEAAQTPNQRHIKERNMKSILHPRPLAKTFKNRARTVSSVRGGEKMFPTVKL